MTEIAPAIHAALTANATIAAMAAQRVYPMQAPQESPSPFIVFARVSTQRFQTLDDGRGLAQPRIEVACWADTFDSARALAAAARSTLDGMRGRIAGVDVLACRLDSESESRSEDAGLYRVGLEFVVTHREDI